MNSLSVLEQPASEGKPDSPGGAAAAAIKGEIFGLIYGQFRGRAICLASRLRLFDLIASGTTRTRALAAALAAHPDSLERFLGTLSSYGVLSPAGNGAWALTPTGNLLRQDLDGALGRLAAFFAAPEHLGAWDALERSVRTGQDAFSVVHGQDAWTYTQSHPQLAETFNRAMSSLAESVHRDILVAYDFGSVGSVVDVGGGHGHLLGALLPRYPGLNGTVFDLPHVVGGAQAYFRELGLADRASAIGGSFFESIPAGADAYLLTAVLHDWNDEAALAILRNCRAALRPGARILLGEFVLGPVGQPSLGRIVDLEMLVMTPGGRERTEADFRRLLGAAGLHLSRIIPLPSGTSLLEAVANRPEDN